jgi:ferric-dicitrate binding protein FerR (iron transport regulator)
VTHLDRVGFADWLGRDPAHRLEFDAMMRVWDGAILAAHLDPQIASAQAGSRRN